MVVQLNNRAIEILKGEVIVLPPWGVDAKMRLICARPLLDTKFVK